MAVVLRVLEILAGLLVLGAAFLWGLPLLLYRHEEPPLPDPGRDVPPENNAWPPLAALLDRLHPQPSAEQLREFSERVQIEAKEHAGGPPPPDSAFNRMYLAMNEVSALSEVYAAHIRGHCAELTWRPEYDALLAELAETLARPALVLPLPESDLAYETGTFRRAQGLRELMAVATVRGLRRLDAGEWAAGLDDLLASTHLGLRLAEAGFMSTPMGFAMAGTPMEALLRRLGPPPEAVVTDPTEHWPGCWSPQQIAAWRAAYERLQGWLTRPDWSWLLTVRACWGWSGARDYPSVLSPPRRVPWLGRLLGVTMLQRALRMTHRRAFAELLRQAKRPPWERDLTDFEQICRARGWYAPGDGYVLRMMCDTVVKCHADLAERPLARLRLQALAVAIKLYQETHQHLPRDWDEVVADGLLAEVPRNWRDGQPVGYDPRAGRLWLTGQRWRELYESDSLNYGYLVQAAAEAFPDVSAREAATMDDEVWLPFVTREPRRPWWQRQFPPGGEQGAA